MVSAYASCAEILPQTVFTIPIARFEIGHTPRKLPDKPSATFRFNAYLFAVSTLSAHVTLMIIPYCRAFCNIFRKFTC